MIIMTNIELTQKALADGWDAKLRTLPEGYRSLKNYFNFGSHFDELDVSYDIKNDLVSNTDDLHFRERSFVYGCVSQIHDLAEKFLDTDQYQIAVVETKVTNQTTDEEIITTGFEIHANDPA
jgi:hypothetical protein